MTERTPDDDLIREEEAAAAAAAGKIGGTAGDEDEFTPEMRAVYEGGGGEAEGFELAEQQLVENASHGEGRANPSTDAFTPEPEGEQASVVHGEPDEVDVTEVVRDPDGEDAEGGEGPGRAHDV